MEDLIKILWTDAIRKGTYLVSTNKSASKNMDEHLKKQGAFSVNKESACVDQLFKDYHITFGPPYLCYRKLRKLLAVHIQQTEDELIALKNYSFSLRNMLVHSDYKDAIKAIEKPSLQLTTMDTYISYVQENVIRDGTDYELDNYRLLYSFITTTNKINRIISRKITEYDVPMIIDELFEAIKESNETASILQARTNVEQQEIVTEERANITDDVAESLWTDENLLKWVRQEGLVLTDLLVDSTLSALQCQRLQTLEQTENRASFMTVSLLVNVIKDLSEQLLNKSTEPVVKQETKQKPQKKAVSSKSLKSDQQWQKEMRALQQQNEQLQKQLQEKDEQLQSYEKEISNAHAESFKLHEEKADLEAQLELFMNEPTVSKTAQKLMSDMQLMLTKLQDELRVPVKEQLVEEASYNDKIEHLQIAIIGGHQKYHAHLKLEMKSDILTIGPDDLNFDPRKLLKYDVVVFTSGYTNHSLYNKAFNYLKKNNAKSNCLMLQTQPNAKQLSKHIYEFYMNEVVNEV